RPGLPAEDLSASGSLPAIAGVRRSCSGRSPPTLSGGRRGVPQTLIGDRQGLARSILRLRALSGGGRKKGGCYVVGRVWIRPDGNVIEAVRSGGGDAEPGRRLSGRIYRVRVVLQEVFLLADLDA